MKKSIIIFLLISSSLFADKCFSFTEYSIKNSASEMNKESLSKISNLFAAINKKNVKCKKQKLVNNKSPLFYNRAIPRG